MRTRYRESRILVRRTCRLPKEDSAQFRAKIARLREHVEQFNVDASELCQWLMGLRKRHKKEDEPSSFGVLGDFLLEPVVEGAEVEEQEQDRLRQRVFDAVAGIRGLDGSGPALSEPLRAAMKKEAEGVRTPTTEKLFARLRELEPGHRLVLLKSAAEWVTARYRRGMENWKKGHEEWEKEKREWEKQHPQLTEEVRQRFTDVFKKLRDPEEKKDKPGVRRKNPRICPYERLRENRDNCMYGQKGHGALCWKYVEFMKKRKEQQKKFNDKRFWEHAEKLVRFCAEQRVRPSNALLSPHMPNILFNEAQQRERSGSMERLKVNWNAYVNFMGLNAETVIGHGRLPHCRRIGETGEKSKCEWNPHTELCLQYKRAVNQFDDATLKLEPEYREWRKSYLAGPRRPSLRYPGSKELPMPKIFGEGFHVIDLERSVLRLRLEGMPEGEWMELGFAAWPRKYQPSRAEAKDRITSAHVNFVGSRCRVGFRFEVEHRESRFGCTQDELDELRSRVYPRQAQDEEFLAAAKKRLLETFAANADKELRLLAVDLGSDEAAAAVYEGRKHVADVALPIVKINKAYAHVPEKLEKDKRLRGPVEFNKKDDPRGLRKEHVGRHLTRISEGAKKIAEHRQKDGAEPATLGDHDLRGLARHVAWMIRDWARHNASRIIKAAEEHRCDLIVFESQRGFRLPGYEQMDEVGKRRLAMFAQGRVRRKVAEKAVERGMRVVGVPYFKSSQVCSRCGHVQENAGLLRKNKKARKFKCEKCKVELNSDANAARLLARVFWGEIRLPKLEVKTAKAGA